MATATVNLPEQSLLPHQVLIKSYSENEGMLQALQEAGVVRLIPDSRPAAPSCATIQRNDSA
jgi:hypothetical protein